MISLRCLQDGYETDLRTLFTFDEETGDDSTQRIRTCKLNVVAALLDAGMAASALASATRYGVQFNAKTIRRWRRGQIAGPDRARTTYAHLVLAGSGRSAA